MTTPTQIDVSGLKMISDDNTQSITMKMEGSDKGVILDYDLTTSSKQFSITKDGVKWTSGATNYTTGLDRLAVIQTAFSAVQLPTEVNSLEIKNTLKIDASGNIANLKMDFDNGVENNLILNDTSVLNSSLPYPISGSANTFVTKIAKETNNRVTLSAPKDIALIKCADPSFNTVDLTVSVSNLGTLPTPLDGGTASSSPSAIFPNNKHIFCTTSYSSKQFYLQNFANSSYALIDLTSLTTGSANYSARIATIGIAQFVPISYTSATNAKFYIRLQENSAANNYYLIICNGDPSLLTSYTYATNYGQTTSVIPTNVLSSGQTYVPASFTNASTLNAQRVTIVNYDSVNDLLILGTNTSSTTNNYFTIVNPLLTTFCCYTVPMPTISSTATCIFNGTMGSNAIGKIYNNNNPDTGLLQVSYWNATAPITLKISPTIDLVSLIPGSNYTNLSNMDFFFLDISSTSLGIFLPYVDNIVSPASQSLNIAVFTWDKNIANNPVLVRTKLLETQGSQTYNTVGYPSVRAYSLNNIEVVSPLSDNYYVSNDGMNTFLTKSAIGIKSTFSAFTNGEGETTTIARGGMNTAQHMFVRGSAISTLTDLALVSIANNQPSGLTEYMSFSYNPTSLATTMTAINGDLILNPTGSISTGGKTIDMNGGQIHKVALMHSQNNQNLTIEAQGTGDLIFQTNANTRLTIDETGLSTFNILPQCSAVPTLGNQLTNKTYVDSVAGGGGSVGGTVVAWTPAYIPETGSAGTYNTQSGFYILIGKLCIFQADLSLASANTATGNVAFSLPIATTLTVPQSITIGRIQFFATSSGNASYTLLVPAWGGSGSAIDRAYLYFKDTADLSYSAVVKSKLAFATPNGFTIRYGGYYIIP